VGGRTGAYFERGIMPPVQITTELLGAGSPLVETVLAWHWHEWSAGHADADIHAWRAGLVKRATADAIPFTLVARVGDVPVGCVTVCDDDGDERFREHGPWLSGMFVLGAARNLGVGRRLLETAEARARELGARELWLHTAEAARFYERCGYELVHRKDALAEDAVLRRSL
jgi:GNAT superfamily N-acetyltransferase